MLLVRKSLKKWVKEVCLNCNNVVALEINKFVFGLDKNVILLACYIPPEGSPIYNDESIKDGVLLLEEHLLSQIDKKMKFILLSQAI